MNGENPIKYFLKRIIAKMINLYRISPWRPFRNILYKIYLNYVEPKMLRRGQVVVERDGIKYSLDLSESQDSEIYYAGHCEPTVVRIIKKYVREGMFVFDIGARKGEHTLRLAKIVGEKGRVFAIDPDKQALSILRSNLELNNIENVIIEAIAFADSNYEMQKITLDEYVKINNIEKIDFIKIDAEGYEYKIIKGGMNSIKKFKPIMVLEFSRTNLESIGDSLEDLVSLLDSLGYSLFSDKTLKKYSSKENLLRSIKPRMIYNVLCKIIEK